MIKYLKNQLQSVSKPDSASITTPVLQRTCSCGQHTSSGTECEACMKKRMSLQRFPAGSKRKLAGQTAPSIVHEVLREPRQPLDIRTRSGLESQFARDFSQVRVHTGAKAAQSAGAVDALAYTVGQRIVFGPGQFSPDTGAGRQLLAHELTHVVQQATSSQATSSHEVIGATLMVEPQNSHLETDAARNADQALAGKTMMAATPMTIAMLQRQPSPIDITAQAIIAVAADTNRPVAERAIEVVQRLINQYYATDASKVRSIRYQDDIPGLSTTYDGTGQGLTGIISVGRYFVEHTDRTHFARRVAQVGHEIEHINQQRAMMGGANRQDEREFRAFYHEALFVERAGTGRMQHSTRVALIDAALGYFNCMDTTLRANLATQRQELLARRQTEISSSGNPAPPVPANCWRQS